MTAKEFRRAVYEKWLMVQVFFQLKMDGIRLSLAIFMCNALQRARNKRFYVIKNAQDKLIWVCNDDIDQMKRPRRVRKLIKGELREIKVSMLPKNISQMTLPSSRALATGSISSHLRRLSKTVASSEQRIMCAPFEVTA